ncbi:MAG: voltage-gated potassium channel [Pseudonocardiales bacterium]|jgi:voltage-gated potassium channel|nr:Potassium channel protein 1 [Pseudonocardiales bacterium]MDT4972382.1 voltage-gated potassium channel [Pseudonocardiales bacterium]MDT4977052.1 voltage-gated potassium channel [Pseudonocardiales bacterium]MDT4980544.1 voltage-gated potassium channel [Pseudonocardiales bacterium]MDT4982526.1 voltage-gated potassium channel [Pseudonocardiales bacterium]
MARTPSLSPVVRRIRVASVALLVVLAIGTIGYAILGFTVLDAVYQTVTTVTTVGFREVRPLSATGKIFTMVLILAGVGTALYALTQLLEAAVDGHLLQHMEARRMDRAIAGMDDHVIICGWGRVGRASAVHLSATGQRVVVVDRNPERLADLEYPYVLGDIGDDEVLRKAGIGRARALVAALDTDADNVYVTLSARALRPDLVIIARARSDESTSKLLRAGADRVVNPQLIGGRRMAAFALAPDVADFLDVVMHDESLDFRIEQIEVGATSPLQGRTIGEVGLAETTGVVILALRPNPSAEFVPNPSSGVRIEPHSILIAIGTPAQLDALRKHAQEPARKV